MSYVPIKNGIKTVEIINKVLISREKYSSTKVIKAVEERRNSLINPKKHCNFDSKTYQVANNAN